MSGKAYYFVNLGCPKNISDGERIREALNRLGFEESTDQGDADFLIVNTCAFIDKARRETEGEIKELLPYKKNGVKLVVVGCYPVLYDIRSKISEVDAAFGLEQVDAFFDYVAGKRKAGRILGSCPADLRDKQSGQPFGIKPSAPYAYVKISDGCDNLCSYCTIPLIRGRYRSLMPERILEEVAMLAEGGVKEIVLVAQDSCIYGKDLGCRTDLADLCRQISHVDGVEWIRVMYAHPAHLSDSLMDKLFAIDKVCRYLDMPIQHISERILKSMRRQTGPDRIRQIIKRLRNLDQNISLRTTLMIGFPGESDDDYRMLLDFVEEAKFDHLGAFQFSPEQYTSASKLGQAVEAGLAAERFDLLIEIAEDVSKKRAKRQIGYTQRMLIEGLCESSPSYYEARSYRQAPEVDSFYRIPVAPDIRPGMMVDASITGIDEAVLSVGSRRDAVLQPEDI